MDEPGEWTISYQENNVTYSTILTDEEVLHRLNFIGLEILMQLVSRPMSPTLRDLKDRIK